MSATATPQFARLRPNRGERMLLAPKKARAKAERAEQKLLGRIEKALAEGRRRDARRLQRLYLRSTAPKIVATKDAAGKQHRRGRIERMPPRRVIEVAQSLDMTQAPDEEVVLYPKRKGSYGYRPIHVFGVQNHARQLMFNRAVAPFLPSDTARQFGLRGGRQAAVRAVIEHISHGARWACEVDIRSFFPTIRRDWVLANLPAGSNVVRETIIPNEAHVSIEDMTRATIRAAHSVWYPGPITLSAEARRGMPQGSACSSLVAEFVVAQVLSTLSPSVSVVNYVDNVLILARTRRELEQALETLAGAFARHPAGPFALERRGKGIRQTSWGFDFLGYHFDSFQGQPLVKPSRQAMTECVSRTVHLMHDVKRHQPQAQRHLRSYCTGWVSAFSCWPGARSSMDGLLFWGGLKVCRSEPAGVRNERLYSILACSSPRSSPFARG